MRRIGYQNAVLTAIAVLLALGLIDRRSGSSLTDLPAAQAQTQPTDNEGGGMMNKLEQGKQTIAELRLMNAKLDRLDAKLTAGLSVKVTSMPAIQMNDTSRKNKNNEDVAPVKPAPAK